VNLPTDIPGASLSSIPAPLLMSAGKEIAFDMDIMVSVAYADGLSYTES
jgi:hypothetical protein